MLTYRKLGFGLNHIATVLSELIEAIDEKKILELMQSVPENAWWQRLGYILSHIDVMEPKQLNTVLLSLRNYADNHKLSWVRLSPELPINGANRNKIWKIIENATIEED